MTLGEYAEIELWQMNHCMGCRWLCMGCRASMDEVRKCRDEMAKKNEKEVKE